MSGSRINVDQAVKDLCDYVNDPKGKSELTVKIKAKQPTYISRLYSTRYDAYQNILNTIAEAKDNASFLNALLVLHEKDSASFHSIVYQLVEELFKEDEEFKSLLKNVDLIYKKLITALNEQIHQNKKELAELNQTRQRQEAEALERKMQERVLQEEKIAAIDKMFIEMRKKQHEEELAQIKSLSSRLESMNKKQEKILEKRKAEAQEKLSEAKSVEFQSNKKNIEAFFSANQLPKKVLSPEEKKLVEESTQEFKERREYKKLDDEIRENLKKVSIKKANSQKYTSLADFMTLRQRSAKIGVEVEVNEEAAERRNSKSI